MLVPPTCRTVVRGATAAPLVSVACWWVAGATRSGDVVAVFLELTIMSVAVTTAATTRTAATAYHCLRWPDPLPGNRIVSALALISASSRFFVRYVHGRPVPGPSPVRRAPSRRDLRHVRE